MAISIFTPSVTGMSAQAQALSTVSTNIANMSTVGYRSNETMFQTLLGHTPSTGNTRVGNASSRVGINGVSYYDRTLMYQQGEIAPTGKPYDVGLNVANGFFVVKTSGGDTYYTRAGNFTAQVQNGVTYLVANNGYKVQGFAANGESFAGNLSDVIIKAEEISPSIPTTKVDISANVPASGVDTSTYTFPVYGGGESAGNNINMVFTKVEGENNVWDVTFSMENGTVSPAEPTRVVFTDEGKLSSPASINIQVTADDGTSNLVTVGLLEMTQYAGESSVVDISQDGKASSSLRSTYINDYGILVAEYENGVSLNLAKLAVVGFEAPENLIQLNATMFEVSNDTGASHYVIGPDTYNSEVLSSQAVESSPVDVVKQFSDMIVVQRAYSLNTASFTANDEMLQTAVNILS